MAARRLPTAPRASTNWCTTPLPANIRNSSFSDPMATDAYTATQTFSSATLIRSGFEFDAVGVANLYLYAADPVPAPRSTSPMWQAAATSTSMRPTAATATLPIRATAPTASCRASARDDHRCGRLDLRLRLFDLARHDSCRPRANDIYRGRRHDDLQQFPPGLCSRRCRWHGQRDARFGGRHIRGHARVQLYRGPRAGRAI